MAMTNTNATIVCSKPSVPLEYNTIITIGAAITHNTNDTSSIMSIDVKNIPIHSQNVSGCHISVTFFHLIFLEFRFVILLSSYFHLIDLSKSIV